MPNGELPTSPADVFDNLDRLRLRQSFDRAKTRRPMTTVGIRKPKPHEWFQVHPEYHQECMLFLAQEESMSEEWFFPTTEEVIDELENLSAKGLKEVCVFWWINRKKNTFVWPVVLRDIDGRQNDWHASMYEMISVHGAGSGAASRRGTAVTIPRSRRTPTCRPPSGPRSSTFGDVLRVAFKKGGRVVDNLDHPLFSACGARSLMLPQYRGIVVWDFEFRPGRGPSGPPRSAPRSSSCARVGGSSCGSSSARARRSRPIPTGCGSATTRAPRRDATWRSGGRSQRPSSTWRPSSAARPPTTR